MNHLTLAWSDLFGHGERHIFQLESSGIRHHPWCTLNDRTHLTWGSIKFQQLQTSGEASRAGGHWGWERLWGWGPWSLGILGASGDLGALSLKDFWSWGHLGAGDPQGPQGPWGLGVFWSWVSQELGGVFSPPIIEGHLLLKPLLALTSDSQQVLKHHWGPQGILFLWSVSVDICHHRNLNWDFKWLEVSMNSLAWNTLGVFSIPGTGLYCFLVVEASSLPATCCWCLPVWWCFFTR